MLGTYANGTHTDCATPGDIGAAQIADVNGQVRLHAERAEGCMEDTSVWLGCADFV
jgi:hypothetical protein